MRATALLVLFALAACRKDAAPAAATATPPPPPTRAAPKSPFTAVPPAPGVISVLEESQGHCAWLRLDVQSKSTATITTFARPCRGARVAFNATADKALVWFDPGTLYQQGIGGPSIPAPGHPLEEQLNEKGQLFVVDAQTGDTSELPWPKTRGDVREVGLGPDGAPRALSLELPTEAQRKAGSLDVDGQKFTLKLEHEGLPSIAHAWRFADRTWQRAESKLTDEGWDMAQEVRALDAYAALGPRTGTMLQPHFGGDELKPAIAGLLEQRTHKHPSPEDGDWLEGHTTAGPFYVWMANAEFSWSTGLLRFADATIPPDLGFTEGDLVGLQAKGPYLLVASSQAGAYPRVYDLRSRALAYSKDNARAAVFWPEPQALDAGLGR